MSDIEWTPERIRAIRESKGWTLKVAAEEVGVSLRTWQAWEQTEGPSQRKPSGSAAKTLARLEATKTRPLAK